MPTARILALVGLATSLVAPVARAESAPPPCGYGSAYPSTASIPSNLPSFLVVDHHAYGNFSDTVVVRLEREEGIDRIAVDGTVPVMRDGAVLRAWFIPSEPLVEGAMHVLVWDLCGDASFLPPVERRYSVGPPLPLPAPPAVLSTRLVARASSVLDDFYLEVTLETTSSLEVWGDMLDIAAEAEGQRVGATLDGPTALFRLAVACEGFSYGLGEGSSEVRARIGGYGLPPIVDERATIDIACADAVWEASEDGRLLSAEEIERVRRAVSLMDASLDRDAGPDAGAPARPPSSCAAAPARGSDPFTAAMAVGLALVLRRRSSSRRAG